MQHQVIPVIFAIFLLAKSVYAQTCPSPCSCSVSVAQQARSLTLTCSLAGQISLPDQSSIYFINRVYVTNSGLTSVPINICDYYSNINTLDVTLNSIGPALTSKSLQCLQNVQILMLAYNKISTIDQNTFTNLPSLVILDLSYNQISSIPIYLFVWPDFTTRRLKNLKYLYLQNNKIVTLDPWFFYLQSIITINLANNQISSFTNNLNFYLQNGVINPQLKVIDNFDLSNNQISAFDDHILCRSFIKIKTQKRKKKI